MKYKKEKNLRVRRRNPDRQDHVAAGPFHVLRRPLSAENQLKSEKKKETVVNSRDAALRSHCIIVAVSFFILTVQFAPVRVASGSRCSHVPTRPRRVG